MRDGVTDQLQFLITGGAGFIGSHLCHRLIEGGHTIEVVDDLSTGSKENISALLGHDRFSFTEGSILDRDLVGSLVGSADRVVHLAAAVGVQLVVGAPLASLTTNVRGTEVVLDACSAAGAPVLLASSSEIYGKGSGVGLDENAERRMGATTVHRWSYALSKAYDETLALLMSDGGLLRATVVRLFNTVGPRQSPAYGMVMPRLAAQAVRGEPLTVYGDGTQTRCFCHVTDTTMALELLVTADGDGGEVYNIGRPEKVSIMELAELIRRVARSSSPIVTIPYEQAFSAGFEDVASRIPQITKIEEAIGWSPRITLEEMVVDVVDQAMADAGQTSWHPV